MKEKLRENYLPLSFSAQLRDELSTLKQGGMTVAE